MTPHDEILRGIDAILARAERHGQILHQGLEQVGLIRPAHDVNEILSEIRDCKRLLANLLKGSRGMEVSTL